MAMTDGIMPVMDVSPSNSDSMGGGMWIFFLFILLMFRDGGLGGNVNSVAQGATLADLNNISNQINGVSKGMCDGFYAQNTSLLNGFAGVNAGMADLGYKMQNCCCGIERSIDNVRFENSKNTCDIITNANINTRDLMANQTANTQRIVDIITQDKIESLRTELQSAQLQLSQLSQTDAIINRVKPCPIPSYPVPNPCAPFDPCRCSC